MRLPIEVRTASSAEWRNHWAEDKLGGLSNRPTREQLEEAVHGTVRDLVAPGLKILFCGINPGRYSAATGHHFAGPGNRFWPTMYAAGFTPRLLQPAEDAQLLRLGFGITNLVSRTTARADLLTKRELQAGVGTPPEVSVRDVGRAAHEARATGRRRDPASEGATVPTWHPRLRGARRLSRCIRTPRGGLRTSRSSHGQDARVASPQPQWAQRSPPRSSACDAVPRPS